MSERLYVTVEKSPDCILVKSGTGASVVTPKLCWYWTIFRICRRSLHLRSKLAGILE
jgi:hypothetical protein